MKKAALYCDSNNGLADLIFPPPFPLFVGHFPVEYCDKLNLQPRQFVFKITSNFSQIFQNDSFRFRFRMESCIENKRLRQNAEVALRYK
jgi:hypothetical protein